VIVRNIPRISSHSTSETVDEFFRRNHPDHYLGQQPVYNANRYAKLVKKRERLQNWLDYYQLKFERHPEKRPTRRTGCLGFCGREVDQIDYSGLESASLRGRWHLSTRKFSMTQKLSCLFLLWCLTRDGALLCAHRHNSRRTQPNGWLIGLLNHGMFIGRILPSHFSLSVSAGFWSIAFVQSLANLEGLEKVAPFLRPVIEVNVVKSFLQGFLPGLALKIFLYILPTVLVIMSKVEGYVSLSSLERRTASKYYYFMLVNVFLGSIIAGTAFEQLYAFLHQLLCDQSRTRRNYNRMAMAYTWFFLEIVCATISMKIPFCKGWMCKSECWLQKKLRKVALKEHKCTKGGIRGRCHCLVCKDVPRLN